MDLAFSCLVWSCEASGKAQTSIETPPEICCFADESWSQDSCGSHPGHLGPFYKRPKGLTWDLSDRRIYRWRDRGPFCINREPARLGMTRGGGSARSSCWSILAAGNTQFPLIIRVWGRCKCSCLGNDRGVHMSIGGGRRKTLLVRFGPSRFWSCVHISMQLYVKAGEMDRDV